MPKIAVALSGGVDSGVAAFLLKKQGYNLIGLHLHFWAESKNIDNKCCSIESLEAARSTCAMLDIPFYVLDYQEQFKKNVVDYFLEEYKNGRTPNPCVVCNKMIKFGKLLEDIKKFGCDLLATGHYVRIRDKKLYKAKDPIKDQTYFLYTLTQNQLEHTLFPIGDLTKSEVRKIAQKNNLPVKKRPESFEICFIAGSDYRDFLRRQIPEAIKKGEVIDVDGKVIGEHDGLPLYTIGQRKGFRIFNQLPNALPLYVIGMDVENNRLIVGRDQASGKKEFFVSDYNFIDGQDLEKLNRQPLICQVKIRHQGNYLDCQVEFKSKGKLKVLLKEAIRGITSGQSAVFYQGDRVVGGGVIGSRKQKNKETRKTQSK